MIYLTSAQFKDASYDPTSDVMLRKAAVGIPEVLPNRCLKFTISTDSIDRDNDRINQKGWKLDNFKAYPVVLWGHQGNEPPVGRVTEIGLEEGALKALVEFVPFDNPLNGTKAEGIYRMCQDGYINAVSVGFSPIDWDLATDDARTGKNYGVDFHSAELFELSIVSIPSNPDALIERPAKANQADATTQLNNHIRGRRQRLVRYIETYGAKI